MEFMVAVVIFMFVNYVVNLYFSIQTLKCLGEFDYENDKEFMDETLNGFGIMYFDDIENKVSEEIESQNSKFYMFLILTFIMIVIGLAWAIMYEKYSYQQIISCVAFVIVFTIINFLDNLLNFFEFRKMKDINYRNAVAEEHERLVPIRIFYVVSTIIIGIVMLAIAYIFNLQTINENYYNITMSVILIYSGGMGLIAKMMFLKVPLKLDGKLAPYINTLILGAGLYTLISSLISILNI